MDKYFFKALAVCVFTGLMNTNAMAQQENERTSSIGNEEIVITKKGDKDTKLTVVIKDGEVKVNGKPLSEFRDENVVITKRKPGQGGMNYRTPGSPFRGGTMNFGDGDADVFRFNGLLNNTNKALLGVMTEKADNGVKVMSVTKGSAAEKAGLKEDDVITRVDETSVASPEDLTKAIGKFKPEDKTVITYRRQNKEQKASVLLGRRNDVIEHGEPNEMFRNFDLDRIRPQLDGLSMARTPNPRLGIRAQDTEEGKGVKVLDVDEDSNAQKAGVQEGDIITEFDGKAVNSATELADAARESRDKSSMKVKLNRNGKSQELEIKIPKKLKTANL
jgi:serine protease Do